MVNKVPPPPQLTDPKWQVFNRWLLELTGILNSSGTIDPEEVGGLPAAYVQIAENTTNITTLQGQVSTLNGEVANLNNEVSTLQGQVANLNNEVSTLQGQVATLQARPVIRNGAGAPTSSTPGNVGDLYLNLTATANPYLYGMQTAGVWTTIA